MRRNRGMLTTGLFSALCVAALWGCAGPSTMARSPEQPAAQQQPIVGKVVEAMDAAGYTYICVEKDGKKTWAAVPAMKVKVGDTVKLQGGTEMTGFESKTLNRTFDSIIFSGGPVPDSAGAPSAQAKGMPSGHPDLGQEKKGDKAPAAKPTPPVLAGKVVETMNSGNYTYLCLEKDGKRGWAAVPTMSVKVGDEVELLPGMEMGQFSSKSLNRTFDNIYFTSGVKGGDNKAAAQTPYKPMTMPAGHATPKNDQGKKGDEAKKEVPLQNLKGKVVETMDAAGYTYVSLEKDGKKVWAAVPTTKVSVGDELELAPGVEMKNFSSKTLNRTFDSIYFSSGLAK